MKLRALDGDYTVDLHELFDKNGNRVDEAVVRYRGIVLDVLYTGDDWDHFTERFPGVLTGLEQVV